MAAKIKCDPRMTRAQKAVVHLLNLQAEVEDLAQAQGYTVVEITDNPDPMGTDNWILVKASGMTIGMGNCAQAALAEALEYLR